MTPFLLGSTQLSFPSSWEELSLDQWLKLRKADLKDLCTVLGILSETNRELWFNAKQADLDFILAPHIEFLQSPIDLTKLPVPESVTIDGKEITIPKDIGVKTFGQKVTFQNQMAEFVTLNDKAKPEIITEFIPDAIAIYLCPTEPFTEEAYKNYREKVLSLPIVQAYPIASFFLISFLSSSNGSANT